MAEPRRIWQAILKRTAFWLALLVVVNLILMAFGHAIPWYLLPLTAVALTLGMMAIA